MKHIMQHDEKDCGAACLAMVAAYYGLKISVSKCRELIKVDNLGANIYGIVQGAGKIGLQADALEGSMDEFIDGIEKKEFDFPIIVRIVNKENYEHFILIRGLKKNKFIISDPGQPGVSHMSTEEFTECWLGNIIAFVPGPDFIPQNMKEGSFKKFFSYFSVQKKYIVTAVILTLLISVINVAGTAFVKNLVDLLAGDSQPRKESDFLSFVGNIFVHGNFNKICAVVVAAYIFKSVISFIRLYLLNKMTVNVDYSMSSDFIHKLLKLPFGFFSYRKTGDILSRFGNISDIRSAVSSTILTLALDIVMAVGFGIFLFSMSPVLFGLTLLFTIAYFLVLIAYRKRLKNYSFDVMEQESREISYLKEVTSGIETIKSNSYECKAEKNFKGLVYDFEKKQMKLSVCNSSQNSLIGMLDSVFVILLLWIGFNLCIKGGLTVGGLMAFYYMMNYFLEPVSNLIQLQPELQSALVSAERLNDILEATPEQIAEGKKTGSIDEILLSDVKFAYGNRKDVIRGLNLKIKKGEKIALVGESGCGKTTIAKLILRFYDISSGSININGEPIENYDRQFLRDKITYISQNVFLFADTIKNNLTMGAAIDDEKIRQVCKRCNADKFIMNMPSGYDTMIEENGTDLSAGQKQRIAIARALLRNPDVIILDEATSNLDSITENIIRDTIENISENVTLIIIAHRLKTIQNCDKIYVIQDGIMTECGTHQQLMSGNSAYKEFYQNNY